MKNILWLYFFLFVTQCHQSPQRKSLSTSRSAIKTSESLKTEDPLVFQIADFEFQLNAQPIEKNIFNKDIELSLDLKANESIYYSLAEGDSFNGSNDRCYCADNSNCISESLTQTAFTNRAEFSTYIKRP